MMDILKRIDHAQQFCKFYADSSYSVETEKWKHHVTPKFIEDIRQYIESLQLKLMHLQTQQAEPVAQRSDGMPTSKTERDLRRMLCIARHGGSAYMDDGEASYCGDTYCRSIDYMRESIESIKQAWYDAGIKKLSGAQPEQQAEPVADGDKVICPACCHQFRGIPETVQTLMLHAGFEPPFTAPPQQQAEPDRRPLQAEGKHPAPCARHCEAKAFEIEIRSLKSALETQAASKEDMKVYRSIVDNYWKGLAAKAEQQAEPTCPDCKAAVLYECVVCSSNNYPPKQQAEPVAETTHDYRFRYDKACYKCKSMYCPADCKDTTSPQRKELSASEILDMMPSAIPAEYDGPLMEFARAVEAKLKERNGY